MQVKAIFVYDLLFNIHYTQRHEERTDSENKVMCVCTYHEITLMKSTRKHKQFQSNLQKQSLKSSANVPDFKSETYSDRASII